MKHLSLILLFLSLVLFSACEKHDEIDFAGYVVGLSDCAGYGTAGYLVQLSYPDAVKDIVYGGDTLTNVMILYEPAVHVMVHDHVSGTFYYDNDYAKLNCSLVKKYDIPEGVFWKIQVTD